MTHEWVFVALSQSRPVDIVKDLSTGRCVDAIPGTIHYATMWVCVNCGQHVTTNVGESVTSNHEAMACLTTCRDMQVKKVMES